MRLCRWVIIEPKPTRCCRELKMRKGVTLADLELVMGQKASKIGAYKFDPESMSFGRIITFRLKPKQKAPKATRAVRKPK